NHRTLKLPRRRVRGQSGIPEAAQGIQQSTRTDPKEGTLNNLYMYMNKIVPIYIANINTRCYLCTLITTK
ncbi:hypothetical protein DHD32_19480, partial [Arenibacter sp. TNZ]|uniref:hypothetical protein n=1 Tax=Arenibacter TaxID=178469 RepID=UPI0019654B58